MKKRWLSLLRWSLAILAVLFGVLSWMGARLLLAPVTMRAQWPQSTTYQPQLIAFPARDGVELKGWFLESPGSKRAVVLLHGVVANRNQMLGRALWLREEGYNVLLYDARGCGESAGTLRSFGWAEQRDLLGALDWLKMHGLNQTACIGFSQGAATVLLTAEELPPEVKALVAESPYESLQDSADAHFRMFTGLSSRWLGALMVPLAEHRLGIRARDVSPLQSLTKLKVPVYFIGGDADVLAPPEGMTELYNATPVKKDLWLVKWAGHGDFFSFAESEYKERIGKFLKQWLK